MTIPVHYIEEQFRGFLNDSELSLRDAVPDDSFDEKWYSNRLKEFLNPNGRYGFGDRFATEFVKRLAIKRTEGGEKYKHTDFTLSWRGKTAGRSTVGLALRDAIVQLEKNISKKELDVVLDIPSDRFVILIENKVFTRGNSRQLIDYYNAFISDRKYSSYRTKEFVYLTLNGSSPFSDDRVPRRGKYWVEMSWKDDVLDILNNSEISENRIACEIREVAQLLEWFNKISNMDVKEISRFRTDFLSALRDYILETLKEYQKDLKTTSTRWEAGKVHSRGFSFTFSALNTVRIVVKIDPKMNLCFFAKKHNSGKPEKTSIEIVGLTVEQLYVELAKAVKWIYNLDYLKRFYKGHAQPDSIRYTDSDVKHRDFIRFVCEYATMLRTVLLYDHVYNIDRLVAK